MKEETNLAMVGRLSPTGSPTSAVTKLPSGKHATTARESAVDQTISEDGSVVRVKAQVMTRSDEGWVLVDGGGVSLVGVFRRCVQVPIAPSFSLLPAQAQSQTQGQAQTRVRSSKEDKKSQKEFLDEPDSAIECSGADDDKTDTCRVQCYECTEFRIRAHRIKDGHETLNYVMNKDLAFQQPQPVFYHWRCVCETCKRRVSSGPGAGAHRSHFSNHSSTNSSWSTRASNTYVNLDKNRLAKNASVDSCGANAPTSITASSSGAFGSNTSQPQQHSLVHNHGSFGLTFESTADARAFDAAVRNALKTLSTEANADAVRIAICPFSAPAPPPTLSTVHSLSSFNQPLTPADPCRTKSSCDSQPHGLSSPSVGRKQSSPTVLDPADRSESHAPVCRTYSDPPSSASYCLQTSNGHSASPHKQTPSSDSRTHKLPPSDAEEYNCLWDSSSATVVARPPNRPLACHNQPFERRPTNGTVASDSHPLELAQTATSFSDCPRPCSRPARGSPPTEPASSYLRLIECNAGPRQLDSASKRSSSLSRLNHFGVRPPCTMPSANTNSQIASDANRSFSFALAAKHGTLSLRAHDTANPNLYVCSSYPHLAANSTQLQLHNTGLGSRSSPSNAHAGPSASVAKTDANSPRFFKPFRSKKRGSRCETASISSVSGVSQSLLANVQTPTTSSGPRRSSKNASRRSTVTRPPPSRACCLYCQEVYYVERNRRGACTEAPSTALRCIRSARYLNFVDSCVHSMLESDDSDGDLFDEERFRSSHSHSSARSSGAHEHEDSGISTFSTSVSHRRQHTHQQSRSPVCGSETCCTCNADDRDQSRSGCCCVPRCGTCRRKRRRCARWTLVVLLSILIPCTWCYWPLKCCAATSCCTRCVGERHKPMPPSVVADASALDHKT